MQDQTPPVQPVPTLLPGQVTVGGNPLAGAASVYQGFRAQRRELGRQLETLESTRDNLSDRLEEPLVGGADRKGLEQRIGEIDSRILALDKQITDADLMVARAAAVPGAAVEPPPIRPTGPPEGAWVLGGMFIVVAVLPLTIAYARRIWRRGAAVVTTVFPKEYTERLMRVEQGVEATALEVERIGEGQRFMTRLFTEGGGMRALHSPAEPTRAQAGSGSPPARP